MIDIVLEGIWSPIVFILVILITTLVAYILYEMGNPSYKRTKHKGEPFISGNRPPKDIRKIHVPGDNLFWGFTEALKNYFEPLVEGHTGKLNDYMYWVVITLAVVLIYIYMAV
ncbi:MAG: hydrogenase [Candidatus Thermoplasmatota archaeon]|nr:hydrogenase [Candidatus Thermoplasmatota archaeon]